MSEINKLDELCTILLTNLTMKNSFYRPFVCSFPPSGAPVPAVRRVILDNASNTNDASGTFNPAAAATDAAEVIACWATFVAC